MKSWWQLGEYSGYNGGELDFFYITCPFCLEKDNFKRVYHAEKKKPNDAKKLNFDTLECGNCKGYVMALWSASQGTMGTSRHDFRILPLPIKIQKAPDSWPEEVGRFWLQAVKNLTDESWDAAAVMARSALQSALRASGAVGNNLKQEIKDLNTKGILPPIMQDWADHLRILGNESAHPTAGQPPPSAGDVADLIRFLDFLLEYLFELPHRIKEQRASKK